MLNNLSNGAMVEDYHNSSNVGYFRVLYNCNTGYTLSGSSYRVCSSSGNWSGSNPSCQSKLVLVCNNIISMQFYYVTLFVGICPILNNPSNGRVSISSGGRAIYSCNTGSGLSGSSSRTCSSSGWSGSNPSCQSKLSLYHECFL